MVYVVTAITILIFNISPILNIQLQSQESCVFNCILKKYKYLIYLCLTRVCDYFLEVLYKTDSRHIHTWRGVPGFLVWLGVPLCKTQWWNHDFVHFITREEHNRIEFIGIFNFKHDKGVVSVLEIFTTWKIMWRGQQIWQTHGGNTGGWTSWFWNKCTMVLYLCFILVYQNVEPVRDNVFTNWVVIFYIGSWRKTYLC